MTYTTLVHNGSPCRVRYEQRPWDQEPEKALSSDVTENVIYPDLYVGEGSFQLSAKLALHSPAHPNAALVLNSNTFFSFDSVAGRVVTAGRMVRNGQFPWPAAKVRDPSSGFELTLERTSNVIRLTIDQVTILEEPFAWRWTGEVGFRCLRIQDWAINATFIGTAEYVLDRRTPSLAVDIEIAPVAVPEGEAFGVDPFVKTTQRGS
jgi:hypothetical protein